MNIIYNEHNDTLFVSVTNPWKPITHSQDDSVRDATASNNNVLFIFI